VNTNPKVDLEELVNEIDSEASQSEIHFTEDECNSYADELYFCDWDIVYNWDDELDDDIRAKIDRLNLTEDELKHLLASASELVFISDHRAWRREVASIPLGELEIELSHELIKKLELLSPDERALVEKETENYTSGSFVYLSLHHCRWSLRYDEESLADEVDTLAASRTPYETEIRKIKQYYQNVGLRLV
jgi:histone deacetylase complex regulatory component SIN3